MEKVIFINLSSEDIILQGEDGKKEVLEASGWKLQVRRGYSPWIHGLHHLQARLELHAPDGEITRVSPKWEDIYRIAWMVAQQEGKLSKRKCIGYRGEDKQDEYFIIVVDREVVETLAMLRYYDSAQDPRISRGFKTPPVARANGAAYGGFALCFYDRKFKKLML